MAQIKFDSLSFNPTPGAQDHRLRAFPHEATPTPSEVYAAPYASVGNDGVVDQAEIITLGGATVEGTYDLYLTAVDAAGNESDFATKEDVPLDLVAPQAPTWN